MSCAILLTPEYCLINISRSQIIMNDSNEWNCSLCTYLNRSSSSLCSMCGTEKENTNNQWQCTFCTFINYTKSSLCTMCGRINQSPSSSSQQQSEKKENGSQKKASNEQIDFEICASPASSNYNASPIIEAKEPIHSKIFEKNDEERCNGSISDCTYLERIGHYLKYYQLLCKNDGNDPNSKQLFIEFCTNSNGLCLDDYIHFISKHSDNESLEKIRNFLHKNHKLNICSNINQCQSTKRHCIRGNRIDEQQNDNDYNFYINLFDTTHFYIYHLEGFGLRVPLKSKEKEEIKDIDDNNYLECTDLRIGEIQKIIQNKRKEIRNLNMQRLDNTNNSKFNIMLKKPNQNETAENKSGIICFYISMHEPILYDSLFVVH